MHVQIFEIDKRLRARCVANAPHRWAMLIKAAGWAEPASARNVKRPAIRAWGQYHSRVIGSMGGECGLLRRRHSGKGRAVPGRLPVDRSFFVAFLWLYLSMPSSTGRARRAVLVTALCAGASLAHAQQLPSIESLSESCGVCAERLCAATR